MSDTLTGRTVAFLMANSGVEQVELTGPRDAVTDAGGTAVLLAPEKDTIQAFENDVEKADTFEADRAVAGADPADYDLLVLPGGTTNPDALRLDADAVAFVRAFVEAGKAVFGVEYCMRPSEFCPQSNEHDFNFLKKDLDLRALPRVPCRGA